MNHITVTTPRPACILLSNHPARSVDLRHTDVAKIWEQHSLTAGIGDIRDDYERTDHFGYLEQPGAFK